MTKENTYARCDELKTVAYQYKLRDVWLPSDAPKVMSRDSYELRELVTRQNAEEVIAAKDARIAELEAKLETANALVTCCCGSLVNDHDMGSGHSPVDQYHYAMVQLEADNKRLREALERIADWPNGGKNYGQENIKCFARAALGEVKP